MIILRRPQTWQLLKNFWGRRRLTESCTGTQAGDLTSTIKQEIENYWRPKLSEGQFNPALTKNKYYVLSMFPYPSGNLHMGHVRVYTIGDAMARFHRMCGKNVFQPIGWDAFGLPAENAAIERGVEPAEWTKKNIAQMKQQLQTLGCSFDWKHELSTCDPNYYKWTQKLFLLLHKHGLAYQSESMVNWDPVDQTVLADEQVDANGHSWRSGAKVQKKLLKQWYIRTTALAENLLEGLNDSSLQDWRDIRNLQHHWIGDCNGYVFNLLTSTSSTLRVWTQTPEYLKDPEAFLVLKLKHYLYKAEAADRLTVENPFAGTLMPVVFSEEPEYAENCDCYLASPSYSDADKELQQKLGVPSYSFVTAQLNPTKARKIVVEAAMRLRLGGHRVSAKLQDWLISRQRYWGTPIPIIHCEKCGAIPVNENELPVLLPQKAAMEEDLAATMKATCPNCGNEEGQRETDTMDTFVDSSWYFLRFLDPNNETRIFDEKLVQSCTPVDLYVGGKEHAVLHLYYARFMNHFIHSQGWVPTAEPFTRLLVQGMVMGKSYRVKGSGRYVTEDEVESINVKKNQAVLKDTKEPVVISWEKMSKSRKNGVDPSEMFNMYGTDTTRLIVLADVAPTSHRNWSKATFPGVLNWQNRLWLTINQFFALRGSDDDETVNTNSREFLEEEAKLFDARNYYVKGVTFNYRYSHQLSVAISKMQGLTNSLRRAPNAVIRFGKEYERTLASQIIMLAPMAPHFASELWAKYVAAPHRLDVDSEQVNWNNDVLQQRWPDIDNDYELDLTIRVNGYENCVIKIPKYNLDKVTHNDALDIAFNAESVTSYLIDKKIRTTNFVSYPGIQAILNIYVDKVKESKESTAAVDEKVVRK